MKRFRTRRSVLELVLHSTPRMQHGEEEDSQPAPQSQIEIHSQFHLELQRSSAQDSEFQSENRLQRKSTPPPITAGPATNLHVLRSLSIARDHHGSLSVDLDRVDGLIPDESMRPLVRVPSSLRV